jgi:cysteine synthase A
MTRTEIWLPIMTRRLPVTGTGGSLSGTATFLKQMNPAINVALSDPEGSGLYNRVKYGVMFDAREKEGRKRR